MVNQKRKRNHFVTFNNKTKSNSVDGPRFSIPYIERVTDDEELERILEMKSNQNIENWPKNRSLRVSPDWSSGFL